MARPASQDSATPARNTRRETANTLFMLAWTSSGGSSRVLCWGTVYLASGGRAPPTCWPRSILPKRREEFPPRCGRSVSVGRGWRIHRGFCDVCDQGKQRRAEFVHFKLCGSLVWEPLKSRRVSGRGNCALPDVPPITRDRRTALSASPSGCTEIACHGPGPLCQWPRRLETAKLMR